MKSWERSSQRSGSFRSIRNLEYLIMNVLLVEDGFSAPCNIREILEQKQISCEVADSTASAMSMTIRSEPDLLLLVAHKGSGLSSKQALDLCKEAKDWVSHLKIIIIAEGADKNFRESAYISGVDDFIDSSFSVAELIARMHVLLGNRAAKGEANHPIASRTMILYPNKLKLYIGDEKECVTLTQKESDLLEILMKNPNSVIERSALVDRLWRGDHCSRSLDNYIKRIRGKLRKACETRELIHTVHGVGYSFSDFSGN
ncbi:MAG: response regulator transcription factor [Cyanobacteria bacterium P01_G01_bin.38]